MSRCKKCTEVVTLRFSETLKLLSTKIDMRGVNNVFNASGNKFTFQDRRDVFEMNSSELRQ